MNVKSKYKVGDRVKYDDPSDPYHNKIGEIINLDYDLIHKVRFDGSNIEYWCSEYDLELYYLIIKDTKIARKLYKNRIIDEKDGYITVEK